MPLTQETFLCSVAAQFLAWWVSEPLLYHNDLICRTILQTLSLRDVVVKHFCNTSVQSTYVEYLASNGVQYPL